MLESQAKDIWEVILMAFRLTKGQQETKGRYYCGIPDVYQEKYNAAEKKKNKKNKKE